MIETEEGRNEVFWWCVTHNGGLSYRVYASDVDGSKKNIEAAIYDCAPMLRSQPDARVLMKHLIKEYPAGTNMSFEEGFIDKVFDTVVHIQETEEFKNAKKLSYAQ